jgi:hypothetical protein
MKAILTHKHFSIIVVVLQCVLWYIVKDDPFFGDAIASTSRAANNIYNHNLNTIFYPLQADPGHPTFYSYLLAVLWKLFGRSLWVSHLYSCLWAVVLVYAFRNIAKFLLPLDQANIATLLVILFPTYLSQSAMMLNTVALMSFFLLGVYGVLTQRGWLIVIAGVLMSVTHLQAVFLLLSLACYDLYRNVYLLKAQSFLKWIGYRLMVYMIPTIVFGYWLWLHHAHTGWLFVSPQYADVQELNTLSEYLKALLLICWRLIDYGMLPFYLLLGFVFYKQKNYRKEMLQWLSLLIPCCLVMAIFLSHTIGHRYFLPFSLLTILVTVLYIQPFNAMAKSVTYIVLGVALLAGNFMYYPGKTLGDATLGYRHYFAIEKQLHEEFGNTFFYSHAPLANNRMYRYLRYKGLIIERINETPINKLPVILQSNINAEFTQPEIDYLTECWFGKTYESGPVYVTIFYNPKFHKQKKRSEFRKPSMFENWLVNLKQRFK